MTIMFCFLLYLPAFGLLTGSAAMYQAFTSSGEMNISSCPITYFGQKYEKVYVSLDANKFAFCFNSLYSPGIQNDCILMSGGAADRGDLTVLTRKIPPGSGVHQLLPHLKHAGSCVNVIPLKNSQDDEVEQVELGNFGAQAILAIKTYSGYTHTEVEADSQVNSQTVSKLKFQISETNTGVIADVSGCRLSGVVYKTNTTTYDQDTCSAIICDVYGVARVVSDCGPMEHCQGDGSCAARNVCTVAGSTVIDINGKVHTVPDRCGYTLLSPGSIPGLKVYGVFQERRRKDVSFLNNVVLRLDGAGVKVSLEQGGRVKLNGDVLKLNATAQVFSGVELSKDKTGVTAKISTSNGMVFVFFDGDKALIQLSGTVQGLCGGSSKSFSGEKVAEYSSAGCEVPHDDTANSTINCDTQAKWCNLLKQAPFTACHNLISPEPFVTACTNTLCKYPAVDDLKCKLLETYTMVCSKQGNVKVEDWRTKTSCYAQNSCQDKFCSDHEFCGQKFYGGEPRCFCRAIFASKYRSESSYGEPTACEHSSAAVTLANCLLEEEGIDYSALHLNDQTCKGEMKDETHMVTFKFDSSRTCGTVVKANDSKIIYKNTIMTQNNSIVGHIYRHDRVHIDFSCFYNQPDIKSLAIKLKQSSVDQQITSGAWIYNLTMKAYTDPLLLGTIESSTNIQMNERIWVVLKTEGLDENVVQFVTESCWATNQPSPSGNLRYDLIIKGCPNPADDTVTIENNGRGPYNVFSFKTFQFTGLTGDVYLHCKVQLCVMQGGNCVPKCSQAGRWRRSIMSSYEDENPALITMAWTY
ncbi:alpha-tectorin-like [Labrus mixtus]|uniref:alpha-tectorin-like n=1 Tax=Labrus mixtus TaxID=508554 RepID=UPI0029C00EF3|nr:alpha-tectorin-like [Labrus mixtus]XP_060909005.1 alpha-tectorin-like [Labrus mixtus]XP_060909006.1 alpha-tectorin-like [Labrus mixtus]